jgi:hypothetical protein
MDIRMDGQLIQIRNKMDFSLCCKVLILSNISKNLAQRYLGKFVLDVPGGSHKKPTFLEPVTH